MIAHSIMLGGPSFPCLCPAVFSFLLFGDKKKALEELPSVKDIPKNNATIGIINLIQEVSFAQNMYIRLIALGFSQSLIVLIFLFSWIVRSQMRGI